MVIPTGAACGEHRRTMHSEEERRNLHLRQRLNQHTHDNGFLVGAQRPERRGIWPPVFCVSSPPEPCPLSPVYPEPCEGPRADSGDFEAEDRRLAKSGNRYLRYYLVQAANKMRQHIPEYADYYARKYAESTKHHHKRALVMTARKSVGLVIGLLHRNEPYRSKEDRRI